MKTSRWQLGLDIDPQKDAESQRRKNVQSDQFSTPTIGDANWLELEEAVRQAVESGIHRLEELLQRNRSEAISQMSISTLITLSLIHI